MCGSQSAAETKGRYVDKEDIVLSPHLPWQHQSAPGLGKALNSIL